MAITYQAGRRIQATAADFGTNGAGIPAVTGGWKELGRTTLGSANANIAISGLADKRYLMILHNQLNLSSSTNIQNTFNSDTGSNYADRYSVNGGSDATQVSQTSFRPSGNASQQTSQDLFCVGYVSNLAAKEKLCIYNSAVQNVVGAANAANRCESTPKWANTSSSISAYNVSGGSRTFDTGSEVVVLGWDDSDTHTTNFWEELASVDWSSGSTISSGTFTAKKYLWIQGWYKNAADTGYLQLRVGNSTVDSGTNYANRYTLNGAADTTEASNNIILPNVTNTGASGSNGFFNSFIINNASNEKLVINHHVLRGGSGAGNAPARVENVSKWSNTSNQINIIEMLRSANNFTAGQIKVWGSD